MLVFSSLGKVYALKSHDIPEASLKARGKPIVNLLPFTKDEKIATFLPLPLEEDSWDDTLIIFATKNGMVRNVLHTSKTTNVKIVVLVGIQKSTT